MFSNNMENLNFHLKNEKALKKSRGGGGTLSQAPKGVVVIKRVSILAISVINRVWFLQRKVKKGRENHNFLS